MKAPKVPKPIRYAVPVDALPILLDACASRRDQLVVALLADTGLRRSELAGVQLENIDLANETIRVWGKGAKQRIVRYGPTSAAILGAYLSHNTCGETLLGLASDGVRQSLERLERRTGIKCNAHAFRRTFACESVRNGLNLFYVQSLLGHSTLTMTRVYADQVGSEDAIRAYKPIV